MFDWVTIDISIPDCLFHDKQVKLTAQPIPSLDAPQLLTNHRVNTLILAEVKLELATVLGGVEQFISSLFAERLKVFH